MFFHVSKIVWLLIVPSTFLTLLACLGLVLAPWRRRAGLSLAAVGAFGLLAGGLLPVGALLTNALEERFPTFIDDGRPVDGVVLLGGAELPAITAARGQPAFQEAGERVIAFADLARRYPSARLLFTGASGSLEEQPPKESETMRLALPALGIPVGRVMMEEQARNTDENARLAKALAQPNAGERWLLVTSAYHMPRAVGSFRAAGFEVVAYPVDYRTTGGAGLWKLNRSVAGGLAELDLAVREWIGLIVYWMSGRSSSPVPGPTP
ncbi:YdcF family protein [Bosea sp. 117]|uniref:YdcF family protein n=1 Tax=Bosea sp. 117 TaxID=1125973 RepID=UPI0004945AE4|nr:YdcF family protein [Bosea sp. 117]